MLCTQSSIQIYNEVYEFDPVTYLAAYALSRQVGGRNNNLLHTLDIYNKKLTVQLNTVINP